MRFHEIAGDFNDDISSSLLTILQHMDSKLGSGTEIPMDDVIRMMNKTGFAFSYEDFKDLYDKSPQLQALVGDHSERSVTVGQQEPDLGDGEPDSAEVVDQIASKAASAAINK